MRCNGINANEGGGERLRLRLRSRVNGLLLKAPLANVKECLPTLLREPKRPQIHCLSPKGEFWERSSAPALFAVKGTLEWSFIRRGFGR